MVSYYSFFSAILWFNITLLIVSIFRKQTIFLVRNSTSVLLVATVLAIVRMFLPLDFSFAYVIRSYTALPALRKFLQADILPGEEYLKISTALWCIWIMGAAIVFALWFSQYKEERKLCKYYESVENPMVDSICAKMNLRHAKVIVSPDVTVPMVIGFFKAHIYLPDIALSYGQWALVINHEYQHFKSHDAWIKLFYLMLSALFWWNPVVHKFQRELDHLLELRCDAKVCQGMDCEGKKQYLQSVLAVIKQISRTEQAPVPVSAIPLVDAKAESFAEQRFKVVLWSGEQKKVTRVLQFCFVLAIFLLSYLVIIQPAGFPKGDKAEGGVRITPENAYILVLPNGKIQLFADGEYAWDINQDMLIIEPFKDLEICYKER